MSKPMPWGLWKYQAWREANKIRAARGLPPLPRPGSGEPLPPLEPVAAVPVPPVSVRPPSPAACPDPSRGVPGRPGVDVSLLAAALPPPPSAAEVEAMAARLESRRRRKGGKRARK
jgi:hypothetical protein